MVSIQEISLRNDNLLWQNQGQNQYQNQGQSQLDLSHHRLKSKYQGHLIRKVSQEVFNGLLTGENDNKYFLTNSCHPNHKVLIQIFKNIPHTITHLNLSANYIIYFPHEILSRSVTDLNLAKNKLRDLSTIAPQLKQLNYNENLLKSIPEQLPGHLEKLAISYNPITKLPDNLPVTLRELEIAGTKIQNLPDNFQQLVNLENLCLDYNPQLVISENLLDFMETIFENRRRRQEADEAEEERRIAEERQIQRAADEARRRANPNFNIDPGHDIADHRIPIRGMTTRTIYNDGQSVHDSHINREILKNVQYLLKQMDEILKKRPSDSISDPTANATTTANATANANSSSNASSWFGLLNMFLPNQKENRKIQAYQKYLFKFTRNGQEILEYLMGLENSKFQGIDIREIFSAYFTYLDTFEEERRNDIFQILENDLQEMRFVCITGRVARLINTLSGFDDNITVTISDNSQIQAKYNLIANKYFNESVMIRNIFQCWEFRSLLMEINIPQDTIQVWMEPFLDLLKETYAQDIKTIDQSIQEDMIIIETIEYLRIHTEGHLTNKEFTEVSNLLRDYQKLTNIPLYLQNKIELDIGKEKFQELDQPLGHKVQLTEQQRGDKLKIRGHLSEESYTLCLAWIVKEIGKI